MVSRAPLALPVPNDMLCLPFCATHRISSIINNKLTAIQEPFDESVCPCDSSTSHSPKSIFKPGVTKDFNAFLKPHRLPQSTTSAPNFPLTVKFTADQKERLTFIVLQKGDPAAFAVSLAEAYTMEEFRKNIADRLEVDMESMSKIHVDIYGTPGSIWLDTWQDFFSMRLKLKNWTGWTIAGGKLVC